ncbi:MAG: (Fe-S)-binding protein, partial [Deltaproteobacteria bacterium]|nr:(Fe-S)-binding protein [Deltaproteobacteria bacterium]
LSRCPVLNLGKAEARAAVKELVEGGLPKQLARACTLCMKCNTYCPEGLRPYELILQRVSEQKDRQKALPALLPYFLLGVPGPNFFKDLYAQLKPGEKAILEKWGQLPEPSREVLWIGCIGRMFCRDLENSRVLSSLPKFSPKNLCCGELHYRTGQWEAFLANTQKLAGALNRLDCERLVCYCGSCTTYLSKIIPTAAGIQFPFETVSLYQWLLEKVRAGELSPQHPLAFKAAVHESCYVSELGEDFADTLRQIYAAAGGEFVELAHHGNQALSCGAAGVVRDFSLLSALKTQARRFAEVKDAGVREVALNCPGCYLTLAPQSLVRRIRLRYMPEELLRAFGDDITTPISGLLPRAALAFARRAPLVFKKVDPKTLAVT